MAPLQCPSHEPLLSVPLAVLRGAEQLQYLQHLLYLLPPCNCDTLLRLLSLLHTVQSYAQDSIGTNDEEVAKERRLKCLIRLYTANF